MDFNSVDIFCHCIDNFGDAGVAYRFAREFKAARPKCRVRLFIDDMAVLHAIVRGIDPARDVQTHDGITYINTSTFFSIDVADVMVETFACHIPEPLMELAYDNSKLIINLEYLSAEDWVEDYHLKESLLGRGTVKKFYFMPGFRETTGGLIINSKLYSMVSKKDFDRRKHLNEILGRYLLDPQKTAIVDDARLVGTVFTYERGFDNLLTDIGALGHNMTLLVFGEKSQRGMAASIKRLNNCSTVQLINMPFIDQHDYDALLCCTDFNIVRGEDSLARAVLSGRPFIWNAYIQDEKYQLVKVKALLKTLRPYYERLGDDFLNVFNAYSDLMLAFNDVSAESSEQVTAERYEFFFKNLKKKSHVANDINYFMHGHCDLIKKICEFIKEI